MYRALKLKACSCLPRWREPRLSSYCFSSLLSGRARLFSRETPADERRIKENEGRKEDDFPEFWDIYSAEFGKGKLFLRRNSRGGSLEFSIDWIEGEECREITKFNPLYRLPISGLVCTRKLLCLTKYFVTDQSYAKSHKVARKFQ